MIFAHPLSMKTFLKHPTHLDIPIQHRKGLLYGRYEVPKTINKSSHEAVVGIRHHGHI